VSPIRPLSHLSLALGLYLAYISGMEMRAKASRRPKGTGTVRQRGPGKWQLRVFTGVDPVTGHPRQLSKTVDARNQTEAQRKLRSWQKELDEAPVEATADSTATVRTLIDEWLRHSEVRGRAPRTLHDARRSAETVIFPEFGDLPITELTPRHLDEWYRKLATGEGRARPLKATSIRRHHGVLSSALSQAVRWEWIDRNPAERSQPPALEQVELQVPTTDEVRALLSAADARGDKWGMLLKLAVLTGGRRGELCGLRWFDVEGESIRFRRSLYRAGAERGEKTTKTGRERRIAVAPAGQALLEEWRVKCEATAEAAEVELVEDAFIVSTFPDGSRPMNPDTLTSVVHKLCVELGIPHVHLHSLRHFAATEMLSAGIDPRNAAEVLGHANPSLTLSLYGHATNERQRQAAVVLGRTLIAPVEPTITP
jgi:integrase